MTFLQIKQRLARRRGANDSAFVAATASRYADAINETYHALLRQSWATELRNTTTTTASVAGTQSYSVTSCARINRIWETTNDLKLEMKTLGWLRSVDPDPQQGTPIVWIPTDVTKTTQSFLLWPTPASVITYTLDITSAITELSADADVPLLPDDFHDLLIDGAELRELRKQDDPQRWQLVKATYDEGVKALRSWIVAHPDYRPGADTLPARSSLGPWFPAGS